MPNIGIPGAPSPSDDAVHPLSYMLRLYSLLMRGCESETPNGPAVARALTMSLYALQLASARFVRKRAELGDATGAEAWDNVAVWALELRASIAERIAAGQSPAFVAAEALAEIHQIADEPAR